MNQSATLSNNVTGMGNIDPSQQLLALLSQMHMDFGLPKDMVSTTLIYEFSQVV